MVNLRRLRDSAGNTGEPVISIAWNKNKTFKEIVGDRPIVGNSFLVGSNSGTDFWLTTEVTEILEEQTNDEGQLTYVKFKTKNSEYELFY